MFTLNQSLSLNLDISTEQIMLINILQKGQLIDNVRIMKDIYLVLVYCNFCLQVMHT